MTIENTLLRIADALDRLAELQQKKYENRDSEVAEEVYYALKTVAPEVVEAEAPAAEAPKRRGRPPKAKPEPVETVAEAPAAADEPVAESQPEPEPVVEPVSAPAPEPVVEAKPAPSIPELQKKAVDLVKPFGRDKIIALINSCGGKTISEVPEDRRSELAEKFAALEAEAL